MKILTKIKNLRRSIIILSSFAFIFNPIAARASEADFLKGIMGAIIVNGIIQEVKKDKQPVIVRKQVTYVTPHSTQNSYQLPRKNKNGLYDTIPQRAFKSQTPSIRYNIQGELMKMGYYNGRLDGYWGYKTEHAISSYALDSNKLHLLTSVKGVNNLFKDLFAKDHINSFMTTKKSSLSATVKPLLKQGNKIVRTRQTHSENVFRIP